MFRILSVDPKNSKNSPRRQSTMFMPVGQVPCFVDFLFVLPHLSITSTDLYLNWSLAVNLTILYDF